MGTDKAFLSFRGQLLVEHALRVLREVCSPVSIGGDPARFARYGTVVEDLYPGCGPLAGIHAALKSSTSELNFCLAVDMPFVSAALVRFLLTQAEQSEVTVAVPRTAHGLQPLCAVYRRSFAAKAEESLRSGRYKIDPLFRELAVRVVEEPDLARHGFSETDFSNVNTPEDLRRLEDPGALA